MSKRESSKIRVATKSVLVIITYHMTRISYSSLSVIVIYFGVLISTKQENFITRCMGYTIDSIFYEHLQSLTKNEFDIY